MSPALTTITPANGDLIAVQSAKARLIRALGYELPPVRCATLEDQAASYRAYRLDFDKCAEAYADFLIDYIETVRGIGNDESPVSGGALRDVLNDWISDETSSADDWADEIENGEWEA